MRQPNAVDFWRGLALVMIFIDHIPGNYFSFYTMRNFAIADAAELFVFLAGWSLSYATGGPARPEPALQTVLRLTSRAIELYRAQLMITMLALGLLASSALVLKNPIFLEWNNAGPAFYDPVRAAIGTVLLTYQLGYFNILPLYIVLLLASPVFIILGRRRPLLARLGPPSWPSDDAWFFNPFSWQLLLVMGFLAAEKVRSSEAFRAAARRALLPAAVVALVGAGLIMRGVYPDPMAVPEPRLLFLYNKTYLSPARLISLISIVIVFQGVFALIATRIGPASPFMCALGRNSLAVFCTASLLSLIGQIIRFFYEGGFLSDLVVVVCGVGLMGFTAWFVEWRSRSPSLSSPRAS